MLRSMQRAKNACLIPYDGFDVKPRNRFYEWPSEEKAADHVLASKQKENEVDFEGILEALK